MNQFVDDLYKIKISDKEFERLSNFINTELGIRMPYEKKLLLQNRLVKRLSALKFSTFSNYIDYVFSIQGKEEISRMVDLITTNTTHFFREYDHFIDLYNRVIPAICSDTDIKTIIAWSAGCSSGEEPYSIAIVLSEALKNYKDIDFEIYATDVSQTILETAIEGVYSEDKVKMIPYDLRTKYFMKSKDKTKQTVRVIPELRAKVKFRYLNFMSSDYSMNKMYDIIFCRNVLIYFSPQTQQMVISKILKHLKCGGYYFQGHSETFLNMNLPLKRICSTVSIRY